MLFFVGLVGRQGQGLVFVREGFEHSQVHKFIIANIHLEGERGPGGQVRSQLQAQPSLRRAEAGQAVSDWASANACLFLQGQEPRNPKFILSEPVCV